MRSGIRVIEGRPRENARFIKAQIGEETTEYTAGQLSGYGLKDGRVFRSFALESGGGVTRYFFERLFQGRYTLYYLDSKDDPRNFFLTQSDTLPLIPIPTDGPAFRQFLRDHAKDCPRSQKNAAFVKLKKHSLQRFFRDEDVCAERYFPRYRMGVKGGMSINRLGASKAERLGELSGYDTYHGFAIGAFIDSPIKSSAFSFVTGLSLDVYKGSMLLDGLEGFTYDLVIDQQRLSVPAMLKYSFLNMKISPFLGAGATYSTPVNGENTIFQYNRVGNDVFIGVEGSHIVPDHQLGFDLTGGLVFKYDSHYSIFLQLDYSRLYPVRDNEESLAVRSLLFSAGLFF
jgi:hypothetical protein